MAHATGDKALLDRVNAEAAITEQGDRKTQLLRELAEIDKREKQEAKDAERWAAALEEAKERRKAKRTRARK